MPCRLSVNTREFTLSDDHASTVSYEILDAARGGGGYVHLAPMSGPEADVLITPATTVTLERITVVQPSIFVPDEHWTVQHWTDDFS